MESLTSTRERAVDAVVVGGGLAGLAAAATLARAGRSVVVVEKARALGGRAATTTTAGYSLNLGPHALYCRGAAVATLRELGLDPAGATVGRSGSFVLDGGRVYPFPSSAARLATARVFSVPERIEAARVLAALPHARATSAISYAEWVRGTARRPAVRRMLEALGRVATYAADLDRLDARAGVANVRSALTGGVRYVDGGWQTIVDGLRRIGGAHGVSYVEHTKVTTLERTGDGLRVALADGRAIDARAVVLATAPRNAADLLPANADLARAASGSVPVRAATLDVALDHLPNPTATFALGLDRPLYFSVHSATAKLAPQGGAVLHAMAYLSAEREAAARETEAELEALVDALQPGWRDHVVERRFLPSLVVSNALVSAPGGLEARTPVELPGEPGVFAAGDWVGDEGLLADAAVASGRRAAERASEAIARMASPELAEAVR